MNTSFRILKKLPRMVRHEVLFELRESKSMGYEYPILNDFFENDKKISFTTDMVDIFDNTKYFYFRYNKITDLLKIDSEVLEKDYQYSAEYNS